MKAAVVREHGGPDRLNFETGFPDCFLQMWAAYAAERAGQLTNKFGCVTPDEAVLSHKLFAAALESHAQKKVVSL